MMTAKTQGQIGRGLLLAWMWLLVWLVWPVIYNWPKVLFSGLFVYVAWYEWPRPKKRWSELRAFLLCNIQVTIWLAVALLLDQLTEILSK